MEELKANAKRIAWAAVGAFVASVSTVLAVTDKPWTKEAALSLVVTAGWAAFRAAWFVGAAMLAKK